MKKMRPIAALLAAALILAACGKTDAPSISERSETVEDERPAVQGSGKVTLSRFKEEEGRYSLTINGVLAVNNVRIKNGSNGEFLAFPQRKGENNRYWNYIGMAREDGDFLLDQLKRKSTENTPQGFQSVAATVKLLDSPTGRKKAFVEFDLDKGAITLYSWAIVMGKDGPYLSPPSEKIGGEWVDIVFPVSKEFREQLQTAALAEYEAQGGVMNPDTGAAVVDTTAASASKEE